MKAYIPAPGKVLRLIALGAVAANLAAISHAQPQLPGSGEPAVNTAFLRDQDDVSAVTQIVLRERQARDNGWWDRMMATYWPDSVVDVSWYHGNGPGFVNESRKLSSGGVTGKHRLFAPIADIRGNRAHVEVGSRNWSQFQYRGQTININANIRINYRLEKRSGEWRILSMQAIYEHSELTPNAPGEVLDIPASELAKYRPSYAALSWALTKKGLTMSQTEVGIDQPDGVKAFYAKIEKWMNE
ncbi:nuclear transport factor 2 family protein [Rhizorhabdus dicambivorans]|nr:nuclear transport factor 2 family protein [Rhizorhabdus dicambivorans]